MSDSWFLTPPTGERFDASALLRLPDGDLLTVNDKGLPACRIRLQAEGRGFLVPDPSWFDADSVSALPGGAGGRTDAEGLAMDDTGRVFLCAEAGRRILRQDPRTGSIEVLPIDWSPVSRWFSPQDGNAAFEGVAFGGGRLYVANERQSPRIVVVDPEGWRVVEDFVVTPPGVPESAVHYSDLCWADGSLWVMCRPQRLVLRVDPRSHAVLGVFDYAAVETDPRHAYFSVLSIGFAEGLWVENDSLWLLIDNNGLPRRAALSDTRPLLLRCPRPDR